MQVGRREVRILGSAPACFARTALRRIVSPICAQILRTWLKGRVPERHSGGAGSIPAVRTTRLRHRAWKTRVNALLASAGTPFAGRVSVEALAETDFREGEPRSIAWEADLVTAPH